uniref:Uncharacterized protein LOC108042112 n=1 Tax=Drosophila rhopaloa TaxID=1041015 RepID=A0A6P4EC54_DRORH
MSKRQREGLDAPAKRAAKNRFKKLVRTVILNMQWLNEATEDTGISLNVKKNVAMLVRQKRKVGMMTMAEKSLLRTPHSTRSVDDRKKLCNIVANLACFSKFPPKVRARLVPHVKFMAVTPGRVIMKEGDVPVTIYFIIAGEVEMSRNVLNKLRKMGLKEIQRACADMKKSPTRRSTKDQARQRQRQRQRQREGERQVEREEYEFYIGGEGEESYDGSEEFAEDRYSEHSGRQSPVPVPETIELGIESETEGSEIFTASNTSLLETVEERDDLQHYETHFIDVGSLTYGGIFGLGEKMDHRVIMARTTVQCILIPRFWLFEAAQNPGNIWQRQRFYIECNIPTREDLFKDFLKTRKWEKFRHDYIQNILNSDSLANFTKVEDIPIISRIVESKADEA